MTDQPDPAVADDATAQLAASARLLGRLLLREVDRAFVTSLEPDVAGALVDLGLLLPQTDDAIEELQVAYHDHFLSPTSQAPLVQSLWEGGEYDGPAAAGLRRLADSEALEYDRDGARGAPVDHLGSILDLWASLHQHSPAKARQILDHHLRWAVPPLERLAQRPGFYGTLCSVTRDLVGELAPDR